MSERRSLGNPRPALSVAERIRAVVEEAQSEALEVLRSRLSAALVEAWWPEVKRRAGLEDEQSSAGGPISDGDPPAPVSPLNEEKRGAEGPFSDGDPPAPVSPLSAARRESRSEGDRERVYVYGFTEAASAAPDGEPGIEPHSRVERIVSGDVCALVARVPAEHYSETRLREAMEDSEWLTARVRNHDEVLRSAAERGTVLPLRLCAVYHDADRVRAVLAENETAISEELQRLRGFREWGVKIHADPACLEPAGDASERLQALRAEVEGASPGRARFARQRLEQLQKECRASIADDLAEAAHSALSAASAEALRLQTQSAKVTGRDDPQILHAAYLLSDTGRPAFEGVLETFEERRGFQVHLTGPWPPFCFSRLELSEPPAEDGHG